MYPERTWGWKAGFRSACGPASACPASAASITAADSGATAFFLPVPVSDWVVKEPPSIKAEPIAWSTVNRSCSVATASSMANGTCSWMTGAARFTPINWLDL